MSINNTELEQHLYALLDKIERLNDSVAPTNLRHHVSETVVSLRNDFNRYSQNENENQFDFFHPEKDAARRYIKLLSHMGVVPIKQTDDFTSTEHLLWMLYALINNEFMSVTKKNRWLGYIQGCLVKDGIIRVPDERDITREIFCGK